MPGPMPRGGSTQATGGRRTPQRGGARRRERRQNSTGHNSTENVEPKLLNLLQWNGEGISRKKLSLTERLYEEDIDIACIQETHLTENLRFTVRGYQTYRLDRENRHKGGVLVLVRNNIPATQIKVDTDNQSEITGVEISLGEKQIRLYNVYCPQDKALSLHTMDIACENCIIIGDFNSHSQSWGYSETDTRGEEVEDWQIDNHLQLLNKPEDPDTYLSRRWLTTSTPDLAFISNNLQPGAERRVLDQLAGSDHRPIKISLDLNYRPESSKPLPRWNYQKAKWEEYARLTDQYTANINTRWKDTNNMVQEFNTAVKRAAKETIPRGARKDFKPYWNEKLQELEDEVNAARKKVEEEPTLENKIGLQAKTALHKRTFIQTARANWKKKTGKLNLDKDGSKLWKLARAMNDEKATTAPNVLRHNEEVLTGKRAADHFMDSFENISTITIPEDRKKEVEQEENTYRNDDRGDEVMEKDFTKEELEQGLRQMKKEKSPGPDGITNELLQHLGPVAKEILLRIFNASWKNASVPQAWREATMIPIHKQGKERSKAESYRPISLTSCVGKLMERLINARLTWFLEKEKIITPRQAGFRQHRSTEDQATYLSQEIEDALQDKKLTLAVWIDLEKAFDKVWKQGLRLKMLQCGIRGHMLKWIWQYLYNRKARVQNQKHQSRKKILKEGVPQGGVLSPTLFIIFMNDIMNGIPACIHGAMYADDLVMWCSAEHLTTATVRMQETLRKIEEWTAKWLVTLNAKKTTYTIFSLSTRELRANLKVQGHILPQDKTPTYLGVTFDSRMTWKSHIEKCTTRAKLRIALMKKLSGTSWGADYRIQRKLYIGRVRPVLEYGISAWGTAAKSNFKKTNRVQNQASRIITGALKSTPIHAMNTLTGLDTLENRRDSKILQQSAKFKRLGDHPMNARMKDVGNSRLKRSSFVHQSRKLERQDPDTLQHNTKMIHTHSTLPAWQREQFPNIKDHIPGINPKGTQSELERKAVTLEFIQENYPKEEWTHVYTDGSAEEATRNGGSGIFLTLADGRKVHHCMPTGKHSTNYKAEAEALRLAAEIVTNNKDNTNPRVAFFSDALSVIQALQNHKNKELNELASAMHNAQQAFEKIVIQWIPSHCDIQGNEEADRLAKEGSRMPQENQPVTYEEAKTMVKKTQRRRWLDEHPGHDKSDGYYQLSREDQVVMVRLRTGHSRLRHHMFTRFRIGDSPACPCGAPEMTVEHFLGECPAHQTLRTNTWPQETTLRDKLYGPLESLRRTAAYARASGVPV